MVVEHRKSSHRRQRKSRPVPSAVIATAFADSFLAIARRRSVASTASDAHTRRYTKTPAAFTVKCSGSTESPSNPPNTAVPSSSQIPRKLTQKDRTK